MAFSDVLNANWFEVVDRGVIVFAGPLEACGDYVISSNDDQLIIRVATF